MHEVDSSDDKWADDQEALDADALYEFSRAIDELVIRTKRLHDTIKGLREILLVQVSILMRIYDVEMEGLNLAPGDAAESLFELHANGDNRNPPMFIPEFDRDKDAGVVADGSD